MPETYGLIFDVDGVIADTEAVNARASIAVFEELFGLTGVIREDFEAGLGRGAEAYVRAAAKLHGLELTSGQVAEATRVRQEKFLAILEAEPLPPFPGVMELMWSALDRPDFKVGIATSSTKEKSGAVLRAAGVPYEQTAYINGSDVTRKKPDPQLFMLCVERMGVVPDRCVVIEDAPDGVQAARSAGCRCVAVTNSTSAEKLSRADVVVGSLGEITIESLIRLVDGG